MVNEPDYMCGRFVRGLDILWGPWHIRKHERVIHGKWRALCGIGLRAFGTAFRNPKDGPLKATERLCRNCQRVRREATA